MLGALGVVYGDIATNPIYSLKILFAADHSLSSSASDVFGVISLIFWTITLTVSVNYMFFMLRADNDGEGGIMALTALARRALRRADTRHVAAAMALGAIGSALYFGDSVITPAISVLSAMEGLEVVSPGWSVAVLPLSVAVIISLFILQPWGTGRVGSIFGPVMFLWVICLGVTGAAEVFRNPGIIAGLSPTYAALLIVEHPVAAFIAMGSVVLTITGIAALYADLSNFGLVPIRRTWFIFVFPALTLNYLGQGALILKMPDSESNPFFMLVPNWARLPMVILATMATIIASQAVISGSYTMARQSMELGFFPRLKIRHTSRRRYGQIYIPAVNWFLFAAVLIVTLGFESSTKLAGAYGAAVTVTLLITTILFLVVARVLWSWATRWLVLFGVVFVGIEIIFSLSTLPKFVNGAWVPLLIAIILYAVMATWQRGSRMVTRKRSEREGKLSDFLGILRDPDLQRVQGTAVFPHPNKETVPLALRANVAHNRVRHENIVIVSERIEDVPHIPLDRRLAIDTLGDPGDGITHISATFGFRDNIEYPEILRHAANHPKGRGMTLNRVTYFISQIRLIKTSRAGMAGWRKILFIRLNNNSASQAERLRLPAEQTIVLSTEVGV
ncbi:KUP/HAK/KT family potassium transporter [Micromonospora sp. WMMA1363]|uniref:potassium transporter Kup n=1 Tax=Micromonospora sp. WMMA1363 TaxID=3053985 RepID=UPI00259CC717|nr:KUP/HAK/KT family potassium transporter [Micromonospora sp. WMMA1363]MDM4723556.1 KUP/HAK/KT family potassium transporter [Micromonospora sp. WMMA1363]MDM4723576.1 KUP/HAK/KT family potassium transporter [Micromonospora sp. WMMA1363]